MHALNEKIPKNVFLVNNHTVQHEDVQLIFSTLCLGLASIQSIEKAYRCYHPAEAAQGQVRGHEATEQEIQRRRKIRESADGQRHLESRVYESPHRR